MPLQSDNLEQFAGCIRLISLQNIDERRGNLIEFDYAALPFEPRRSFVVENVPKGTTRGGHAHKSCEQLLVCLRGQLTVRVVFRNRSAEVVLDGPYVALYMAAGVWAEQTYDKDGTCLLAFASQPFDPDSYLPEPSE